jgi:hypothetical protein
LKDQGCSIEAIEAATAECDKIRARREASTKATMAGQVCADLVQNLRVLRLTSTVEQTGATKPVY